MPQVPVAEASPELCFKWPPPPCPWPAWFFTCHHRTCLLHDLFCPLSAVIRAGVISYVSVCLSHGRCLHRAGKAQRESPGESKTLDSSARGGAGSISLPRACASAPEVRPGLPGRLVPGCHLSLTMVSRLKAGCRPQGCWEPGGDCPLQHLSPASRLLSCAQTVTNWEEECHRGDTGRALRRRPRNDRG